MDVFRINMSHTNHEMLRKMVGDLRALSQQVGRPIGILCDLQGPKIRLGRLAGGPRMLKEGERVKLVLAETNEKPEDIPIPHPEIFQAIKQKHALLIDDGKVRLRLLRKADTFAEAIVEVAGEIKDRKGVNMPDTLLPLSAMTPKDRADLDAALELGVDWVALSFVQRPEDVAELKKIVQGRAGVLAKIEKPKALASLDGILELCGRADGGARRSGRGDAAGSGAGPTEADHPRGAQSGQARGGGNADAGIHDPVAGAHPRRGIGRGDRGVRRRRCGNAVGGIGIRRLSRGSSGNHGPHRPLGRG